MSLEQFADDESLEQLPAALTDIGCERDINEDLVEFLDTPVGRALLVCDGMGGTLGGELAAKLAIDAIRRSLDKADENLPGESFVSAVEEANRVIVLRRQNPAFSGMGTTFVGVLIADREITVASAGDSRAYLVRGNKLEQLTVDHTYVQDLVEKGAITLEEALSHPQAHVLTRCLGAEPRLRLDVKRLYLWDAELPENCDKLLLCSDGLYSLITDVEIAEKVSTLSPQQCCAELVELARSRGGFDNITVAVMPLGAQVREDVPPKTLRTDRESSSKLRTVSASLSRIPIGKQAVIISLLVVLGFLFTAVGMFVFSGI